jgi:DNA primase
MSPAADFPPIDFRAVAERSDLVRLVEADLGPAERGRKWCCPFHDDHNPSMTVRDGKFKCWSCGAGGDAIDWVAKREGLTKLEAALRLDPTLDSGRPRAKRRNPPAAPARPAEPKGPVPAWQDPAWQEAVSAIVREAEASLWGSAGRDALAWLRARGLADYTIGSFRLGFLPERGEVEGIRWERGITIPWVHPDAWYSEHGTPCPVPRWVGCNVRRLSANVFAPLSDDVDKCRCLRGSTRGLPYPLAGTQPGVPVLIVEGEFDALIGWQELGWVVNVLTVGSANQRPSSVALSDLDACPAWLLAFDHDQAGNEAARAWWRRSPEKAKRVQLPGCKDLNDFVRQGGDALAWLAGEYERLGWVWPLRRNAPERLPVILTEDPHF